MDLPEHVGEVYPRIRILCRRICARDPRKATVLLEETLERAAAGATVQPDRDFIDWSTNGRLEHEEQSPADIVVVNWDQTRIEFAQVKGKVRQRFHKVC